MFGIPQHLMINDVACRKILKGCFGVPFIIIYSFVVKNAWGYGILINQPPGTFMSLTPKARIFVKRVLKTKTKVDLRSQQIRNKS
jgi:hypothetical protein